MQISTGRFLLILVCRLVLTAAVQFGTIYSLLYFDPQNPIGYLLILLPFAVIPITIVNWAIMVYTARIVDTTQSGFLRIFLPILVVLGVILFLFLLSLIPIASFYLIPLILAIFLLPALILETLGRYLWRLYQ